MIYSLCPIDQIAVVIDESGFGRCSKCEKLWRIPLMEVEFTCEHEPQPVQGWYQYQGERIEYRYCSMECKEEQEGKYEIELLDLGLK